MYCYNNCDTCVEGDEEGCAEGCEECQSCSDCWCDTYNEFCHTFGDPAPVEEEEPEDEEGDAEEGAEEDL